MKNNNQIIHHLKKVFIVFTLTIMLASCAAVSGRETTGEYIDDATVTTKVKAAILNDPTLKPFEISVETFQNEVQLSGFVDSQQAADKAKRLASKVKGVHGVKNDIVVRHNKN